MKINNIKSTNYQIIDKNLVVDFENTTFDEISNTDFTEIEVKTDVGDLVETISNYVLDRIIFNAETSTFQCMFTYLAPSTLDRKVSELEKSNNEIAKQLESTQEMLDALLMGEIEI